MKQRRFILVGVLVFLGTLLAQTPVALVLKLAQPKTTPRPVLLGASGTVTSGRAEALNINGRTVNETLTWSFQPQWLMAGALAYEISGTGSIIANGSVQYGLRSQGASNLVAEGGLKDVASLAGMAFVPADGRLKLNLSSLRLKSGIPTAARGTFDLGSLQWTLARPAVLLGDVHADLNTQISPDGTPVIVAEVRSTNSPLDISGQGRLFPSTRRYEIDLLIKAKANADTSVTQLLNGMGPPDAQGNRHLRSSGSLPTAGGFSPSFNPGVSAAAPAVGNGAPAIPPEDAPESEEESPPPPPVAGGGFSNPRRAAPSGMPLRPVPGGRPGMMPRGMPGNPGVVPPPEQPDMTPEPAAEEDR